MLSLCRIFTASRDEIWNIIFFVDSVEKIPYVDIASIWEFPQMKRLISKYPNLYFDIAGMVAPHCKARLMKALAEPVIRERIVFGTDYPITLQSWAFRKETRDIVLPENYYATDIAIKECCGLTPEMLDRGHKIIREHPSRISHESCCGY